MGGASMAVLGRKFSTRFTPSRNGHDPRSCDVRMRIDSKVAMVPARRSARTKTSTNGVIHGAADAVAPQPLHVQLGLDETRLAEMFETMLLARAVDERQWILNRQGKEPFHISCQGHEGAGVGSAFALDRERDVMVPYYRSLAAVLAFGVTPR